MRRSARTGQACHGAWDVNADGAAASSQCARYIQLFETMAQGVVYQDGNGRIVSANPAAERILGLSLDQMTGRTSLAPIWKSIHADGREFPGAEHPSMVALRSGQAVSDVVMGVFHPGQQQYRWILVNAIPNFCSGESLPFEVFSTFTDITELKLKDDAMQQARQQLEAKDALLQQVVDCLPQRLFWKDRNGAFRGCNMAGAKALGLQSPDEIAGRTDYDFYPSRLDGDFFFKQDLGVMESGASHYHTLAENQKSGGEIRWLDITKVPLRGAQGNIDGLLVSYEDVTDLSRVEESLRKFKQVVEQSPNTIIITGLDANIEYVNPAFCRTYGYGAQEVLGRNPRFLKSASTVSDEWRALWSCVCAGQVWQGEFLNHKKDGGQIWQSATISPIFDQNGAITHFLSIQEDIGARKQNEIALQAAKNYAESLIATANAMVVGLDGMGRVQVFNRAAEHITGYTREEILNQSWFETITPRQRYPEVWQEFERLSAGGLPKNFENAILTKSGEERYIVWQNNELYENCKIAGTLSFGIDITERVQAETARKKAEEDLFDAKLVLQLVLDHIPQQVFWKDADSVYAGANAAYLATCGVASSEALKGKTDFDFHAPELARKYRKDDGNVMRHDRPRINYEELLLLHDGEVRWAETSKIPLHDREGKVVGVLGMFQDITERKAMQRELADTLSQLRTILDNAQVGIAFLRENKLVWINRRMEEMFGYKLKQIREQSPAKFYPNFARIIEQSLSVLTQGKPFEIEHLMVRKNVRRFWCHMRGMAVDTRDITKGSIWTLMDIDSRKAAEQELLDLSASLAQQVNLEIADRMEKERLLIQQSRHAAMGEMIGNIAHQWRQPLSVLGLILQNIGIDYEDKQLSGEALKAYLADAMRAIRQMSGTIDDFRDFFLPSRQKDFFNIRQTAEETVALLSASLKNHNIKIKLNGLENIEIHGHRNEFAQVLLNLIGNAKDALEECSSGQPEIEIEIARNGGHAIITVSDNAGGIAPGIAEKIFDPYFTTKKKGTGIGLYMTKTILEKHMHGSIVFRNGREGAEFIVKLPLEHAPCSKGETP